MLLTRSDPPCRRVVCGRDVERLRERLEESAMVRMSAFNKKSSFATVRAFNVIHLDPMSN